MMMILNHEIEAVVSFSGYRNMEHCEGKGKKKKLNLIPFTLWTAMTLDPWIVVWWSSFVSPFVTMVMKESLFHDLETFTAKHHILYYTTKFVPVFFMYVIE